MTPSRRHNLWLAALALPQLALYVWVRSLGWQPRLELFMAVFGVQFSLYLAALALVHRYTSSTAPPPTPPLTLFLILLGALAFRLVMVTTPPSLSSDVFRYVWDGRVQAAGLSPYAYPPGAAELAPLRDADIWPRINRKESVTIYPPAAQLLFWLVHAVGGDSVWAVKWAMLLAECLTLALLALLLRDIGQPVEHLVLYAWSPLVVYEVVGSGHLEGLMLPCLVLALLAARRGWDAPAGAALAAATLMKLFPILLLPALWWRRRLRLPLAFGGVSLLLSLPYWQAGLAIATYYPDYLREQFNMSLAALLGETLRLLRVPDPYRLVQLLLLAAVAALALWHLARPAPDRFLQRGLTMIGLLTVGSQFLQPWYLLWLLPFLTALWPTGDGGRRTDDGRRATDDEIRNTKYEIRITHRASPVVRPPSSVWLGWLLFSGTITLSYHFYVHNQWNIPLVIVEYTPLYGLLLWAWLRRH